MIKKTLILLGLIFSFPTFSAQKYIFVIIHGKGFKESKNFNLRKIVNPTLASANIEKVYDGSHNVSRKNFYQIFENFDCENNIQKNNDLGLIIMGYSWGAKRSYDLSKDYFKKCGRKADRAYMIDGILKPISPFPSAPIANICKNHFKTIAPIRGKELKNCENFDKTQLCIDLGGEYTKGMKCHQYIIEIGTKLAIEDITENL